MSFLGWIAGNSIVFLVCLLMGVVGLGLFLYGLVNSISEKMVTGWVILGLVLLLIGWRGGLFVNTHFVVPVNSRALVVDTTTGRTVGDLRSPGLTTRPFWGTKVLAFPGATNYEVASTYGLSVQGGYGVDVKVVYFVNATKIDWLKQFVRANKPDFEGVHNTWDVQLAARVGDVIKMYQPYQLTELKTEIQGKILATVKPWFDEADIPLNSVSFPWWDFTNKEIGKLYDESLTLQSTAQSRLNAASTDRQTELFKAETEKLVLAQRIQTWKEMVASLGLTTEQAKIDWLTLQWLQTVQNPTVVVGGQNVAVIPK